MDAEVLQGSVDDASLLDTVHDLHAEVRRVGAVSHAVLTAAVRGEGTRAPQDACGQIDVKGTDESTLRVRTNRR
jgi:hypothetical protein